MSRITTASLLLSAVWAAPGCLLPPEIIGETLTSLGSGESDDSFGESTTSTTGASTGTEGASTEGASTGAEADDAYGSFCELVDPPHPGLSPVLSPQSACEGDICVLVKDTSFACFDDAECVAEKGEGSVCDGDGFCTETPAFLAENTRCTQSCETVEDCPPIPGCETGLTCAPGTMLGELCCQKVCLCNDHLDIPWVTSIQDNCEADPDLCA